MLFKQQKKKKIIHSSWLNIFHSVIVYVVLEERPTVFAFENHCPRAVVLKPVLIGSIVFCVFFCAQQKKVRHISFSLFLCTKRWMYLGYVAFTWTFWPSDDLQQYRMLFDYPIKVFQPCNTRRMTLFALISLECWELSGSFSFLIKAD